MNERGTIPEPSASHIGKGVAPVAQRAAFVYIYARIPQIAEMTLSFHATIYIVGGWVCHGFNIVRVAVLAQLYLRDAVGSNLYAVPELHDLPRKYSAKADI